MELFNLKGKQNSIREALDIRMPGHAMISVTGAGGKTSLISAWARELAAAGKKAAITTTTHMHSPAAMAKEAVDLYAGIPFIDTSDKTDSECIKCIDDALDGCGIVFVAASDKKRPGKVTAPSDAVIRHLRDAADAVLIEADGSKRMPLKWPAAWEPAVPEETDITVYVAGLSALGKRPDEVIFRSEDLPDRLRRETVDHNLLHSLISSREGGRKGARGEFRVFLNQIDDDIDRLAAAYRLQQFFSVLGIQTAWGSLQTAEDTRSNMQSADVEAHQTGSSGPAPLKIAFILEAAGNSTRFGSNKLLHIMKDGRPMAACIMDSVSEAISKMNAGHGIKDTVFKKILVTQYDDIAMLAPDFDIVMNDRPDLGISLSMQLGIEAAGDADAYMFCVCDQPYLSPETLCRMIYAYKKGTAGIVSLAWQGTMCNPKIFSSRYRDELMSLTGDTGGRQIIASHNDDLMLIEATSESEVRDIDEI